MSATSINRAANDVQLRARIDALTQKEVLYNPELAGTDFGQKVRSGMATMTSLYWATAVVTEDAYEEAMLGGNGSPGYDENVISDAEILSAIKSFWPPDPPPLTPPAT